MRWGVYCFASGFGFSLTWWVAVGYPNTKEYYLTLGVLALLVVLAPVFKEKGKI